MKTTSKSVLAAIALLCSAAGLRAVNDGLWMGFKYSVAVKYLGIAEKGVDAPQPKTVQMPEYPIAPMRAAVSGDVLFSVLVAEDGSVREVKIEQSPGAEFAEAAKAAAVKWLFFPARERKDGRIVPAHLQCRFEFRAKES